MKPRSWKLLLFVTAGVALVAVLVLLRFWTSPPQQPVFRLREVRSYVMPERPPPAGFGDRQVEADFEYVGPQVSPRLGRFRRILMAIRLVRPPPAPKWHVEDVVLLDAQGRELFRLAPRRSTTRPSVHGGFVEMPEKRQLVHLWNFDLPPEIDPSAPVTFHTRLGVHEHAPVLIEVKLPALPKPAASQPATTTSPSVDTDRSFDAAAEIA